MEKELELAQEAVDVIVNFLVTYSFQLIGAVIILIAGFVLGGWVSRALLRVQQRQEMPRCTSSAMMQVVSCNWCR